MILVSRSYEPNNPHGSVVNKGTVPAPVYGIFSSLIFTAILFIPAARFDVYYLGIIPLILIYTATKTRLSVSKGFLYCFVGLLGLLYFALFKAIMFQNIYDLKEWLKVALFFLIVISAKKTKLIWIQRILFVHVAVDFVVSLGQFLHFENTLMALISNIYNADSHAEFSLGLGSVRSLGLSPGPGQHGILSLLSFIFFLTFYSFDKLSKLNFFGILFSLMSIFLSQSKTAFLVLILFSLVFLLVLIRNKNISVAFIPIITCGLFTYGIIYYWETIIVLFYDLQRLADSGLNVSSFGARLTLWEAQLSAFANANPILLLFGAGRGYLEYLNIYHNSFDNDYVYILVSYGLLGLSIFLILLLGSIMSGLLNFKKSTIVEKCVFFILIGGALCGLALDFFSDLKTLSVLAFLIGITIDQKKLTVSTD